MRIEHETDEQLAEEISGGAEVPFELIEQGRASAPLYCYRPLTGRFLADRSPEGELEIAGGAGLVGNEIVLDASSVTFAAGETKRQVFDFTIGSTLAQRRVPPGTYMLRGGYGVQFTPSMPLTIGQ